MSSFVFKVREKFVSAEGYVLKLIYIKQLST